MAQKLESRIGTSAQAASANPTLLSGEIGLESDTRRIFVGDGSTAKASLVPWNNRPLPATKAASYTILDNDADIFRLTGASANSTFTLPTLAANQGRIITLINDDSTYRATLDGEGAETIAGAASITLYSEGSVIAVWAGAAEWEILYLHAGDPATNAVRITGEYLFTASNGLNYSASFTDGMSAGTVTFSELPADTVAVFAEIVLSDTGAPYMQVKHGGAGGNTITIGGQFADGGTNLWRDTLWVPTDGNALYVEAVNADTSVIFYILGYKTGS